MKRTFALSLLFFGLMSCSLLDNNSAPQPSNTVPTVALNASTLSGPAPLQVTFTATASDAENDTLSYRWSIAGAAASPTISQTFTAAGSYPVSVTVSDGKLEASANTTVTVTEAGTNPNPPTNPEPPTNPNPPTNPDPGITLNVTASPGGPVPWGVTYKVETKGDVPKGSTLSVTCAGQPSADLSTFKELEVKNVFSCIHLATGEKIVSTLKDESGKVVAQKEQTADVQTSTGIPFEGSWEYRGYEGDFFFTQVSFDVTTAVNTTTGRGEGGYLNDAITNYPEYPSPLPTTFTLTAKVGELEVTSASATFEPLNRQLVFVGQYANDRLDLIEKPTSKQIFLAPNEYKPTETEDTTEGYLYKSK